MTWKPVICLIHCACTPRMNKRFAEMPKSCPHRIQTSDPSFVSPLLYPLGRRVETRVWENKEIESDKSQPSYLLLHFVSMVQLATTRHKFVPGSRYLQLIDSKKELFCLHASHCWFKLILQVVSWSVTIGRLTSIFFHMWCIIEGPPCFHLSSAIIHWSYRNTACVIAFDDDSFTDRRPSLTTLFAVPISLINRNTTLSKNTNTPFPSNFRRPKTLVGVEDYSATSS